MSGVQRRWLEVSVRSPSAGDREALLVDGLIALGGRATEERDGWYVTHLEEPPDLDAFVAHAASSLRDASGLGDVEVSTRWRDDEAWHETWKLGIEPRLVSDRILVRPSWIEVPEDAGDIHIVIDPGMAFGTAHHATTRGCLRLLDRAVREGDRVLDIGSGSGILAIAAARLGASEVVAIEADPLACETLRDNVDGNGVAATVRCIEAVVEGADLARHGPADGVVANIVSGVLMRLMPGLAGVLRPGGWLILSGIQSAEWQEVLETAERGGLRLCEVDTEDGWRSAWLERGGD